MLEIFDGFIAAIGTETKLTFNKESDNTYSTNLEFEGGRKQKVLVFLDTDDTGDSTVNYYSIICRVNEDDIELYKKALALNTSLTYGAIALMDDSLVIHQTYYMKDMDPERFIKSLFYVAAKADELEEEIIKEDIH